MTKDFSEDYLSKLDDVYCSVCGTCGDSGCCSPVKSLKKHFTGCLYNDEIIEELAFAYLFYEKLYDMITEMGDKYPEVEIKMNRLYRELQDEIRKEN